MRISDWSSDVCSSDLILDRFAEAAEQAGIPRSDDFNTGDNSGSGKFEVTQRRGVRWSASRAFLRPALKRPNLQVVTGALSDRLRMDGTRVSGVEFIRDGERLFAESRIETVLASGSIGRSAEHTSELQSLMRSSYDVFCLKK